MREIDVEHKMASYKVCLSLLLNSWGPHATCAVCHGLPLTTPEREKCVKNAWGKEGCAKRIVTLPIIVLQCLWFCTRGLCETRPLDPYLIEKQEVEIYEGNARSVCMKLIRFLKIKKNAHARLGC